jgi:hypothetical protein
MLDFIISSENQHELFSRTPSNKDAPKWNKEKEEGKLNFGVGFAKKRDKAVSKNINFTHKDKSAFKIKSSPMKGNKQVNCVEYGKLVARSLSRPKGKMGNVTFREGKVRMVPVVIWLRDNYKATILKILLLNRISPLSAP